MREDLAFLDEPRERLISEVLEAILTPCPLGGVEDMQATVHVSPEQEQRQAVRARRGGTEERLARSLTLVRSSVMRFMRPASRLDLVSIALRYDRKTVDKVLDRL